MARGDCKEDIGRVEEPEASRIKKDGPGSGTRPFGRGHRTDRVSRSVGESGGSAQSPRRLIHRTEAHGLSNGNRFGLTRTPKAERESSRRGRIDRMRPPSEGVSPMARPPAQAALRAATPDPAVPTVGQYLIDRLHD